MNTITKSRVLSTVIILLLIANIATLAFFWLKKRQNELPPYHPPIGGPYAFIVKELAMDSTQILAYAELRNEHQKSMDSLREETRAAKDALFNLLQQPNVSDSILQQALHVVGEKEVSFDKRVFLHFQKVRTLCKNEEQRKKFDTIIKEALRMTPGMQPRRDGPPPMGKDGHRPPPPSDGDDQRPPPPEDREQGNHPPR